MLADAILKVLQDLKAQVTWNKYRICDANMQGLQQVEDVIQPTVHQTNSPSMESRHMAFNELPSPRVEYNAGIHIPLEVPQKGWTQPVKITN